MRLYIIPSVVALFICFTVPAVGEDPENILKNGGFEVQFDNWSFWTEGGAIAERQIDSKKEEPVDGTNVAYVKIDKAGTGGNHIQFYQGPFPLKKDTTYTLSVWGKTEEGITQPVDMRVLRHQNPWTNYITQVVTFTETWNEYSVTFKQPVDDNIGRVDFFLGRTEADVWLDHVRFYEGEYFNDGVREIPQDQPVRPQGKLPSVWGNIKMR